MDDPKPDDKPTCDQCGSENLVQGYKDSTAFGSVGREQRPGMFVCLDCEARAARGDPPVTRPTQA
jgi:transcription elongation factor Elf1